MNTREDGRQRDRVEIVAEPHRGDAVERDFDVVGGEVAQARRHQPDQPVEDDLQHRQTLVGHHRRVDDGANAGVVVERDVGRAEAEQRVDFVLAEHALGAALGALHELGIVVDHRRPIGRPLSPSRWRSVGAAGAGCQRRRGVGIERKPPLGGERVLVDLVFVRHESRLGRHCTMISLNSTALIWLGAIATLTRRVSSSLSR